jgi:phosphatidylglycerol:prolipoprotein diacylglycerol transferase
MTIPFDPILVTFGPLAVRWFGLLALVGLAVAVGGTLRALRADPKARAATLDALAWALPIGVVMARAVHVIGWWDYYFTHSGEIWQLSLDGLSLWGGLLGGGAVALARLGRDSPRRWQVLDAAAPSVALGIAIGRLGAFLDGHGQGLPSDAPWATQYANPLAATPDFGVSRHPAQAYDGLVALGLWLVLSRIPAQAPAGTRAVCLCLGYAAARLVLGSVRADPAFLFGLQIEQLLALVAVGWGVIVGARLLARIPRERLGSATAGAREQRPREDSMAA